MIASNTIYMPKEGSNYSKICQDLLKGLPGRTTEVISRRFGLKGGQEETLEAIGKSFGITRERVRQIEQKAIAELKRVVELERRESGALGVHSRFSARAWSAQVRRLL